MHGQNQKETYFRLSGFQGNFKAINIVILFYFLTGKWQKGSIYNNVNNE
jgi:hypothetical protein